MSPGSLNSNLAKIINGGLQAGQVTGISLEANAQTEVTVNIPVGYNSGNDYIAVANLEFYGSANQFSSVLIRNKYGSSFTCRIHYTGTTAITSAALNWMTMKIV